VTGDTRIGRWLLLLFQLPARPTAARVRTWRQLQRLGAQSVRNSGYVLPLSDQAREDFEWLRADILAAGGNAMILVAETVDPAADAELAEAFRASRVAELEAVRKDALAMAKRLTRERQGAAMRREVRFITERLARLEAMPPVGVSDAVREHARAAVDALQDRNGELMRSAISSSPPPARLSDYAGRTWVTRPRPGIDRFASAWLIRRFIDPRARFAFAPSPEEAARFRRAVTFDMYGGAFTHQGGGCTFETLTAAFGVRAPEIDWLAGLVHALDLKVEAEHIPEAAAVSRLVEGLRAIHADDRTLLDRGMEVIDALYRSRVAQGSGTASPARRRRGRARARR
jgi:hypothetical protein